MLSVGRTEPVERLNSAIAKIVEDYAQDITRDVGALAVAVAKTGVQELKRRSPRKTGEYAKGWKSQVETSRTGTTVTIYNGKKPWLAHLLENGHAKRGGGRVAPRPHIRPVEEKLVTEFEKAVIKEL